MIHLKPGESIQLVAPDSTRSYEMAIGGGALAPFHGTLTAPVEGDHWIALIARDPSENVSPVSWFLLRVDGQAPTVSLTIEPEPLAGTSGTTWLAPNSEAHLEAADDVSGVAALYLTIDDTPKESFSDQLSATLPQSGTVSIRAWGLDRAGNRGEPLAREYQVDDVLPTCQIIIEGIQVRDPSILWTAAGTRFRVVALDRESGLGSVIALSDGAPVDQATWLEPWPAGPHEIRAEARDRAGNQVRSAPLAFHTDNGPPHIEVQLENTGFRNDLGRVYYKPPMRIRAIAKDELSGVASLEWSVDGLVWQPLDELLETPHSDMKFRAVDRVGNQSIITSAWEYDEEPPAIQFGTDTDGDLPDSQPIALSSGQPLRVTTGDGESGLAVAEFSLNQTSWQALPEIITFKTWGRFELRVRAFDQAGNKTQTIRNITVKAP